MEEVKYIPGDLVKIQPGANWFSKENSVLIVRGCNNKGFVKVNLSKYKPGDIEFKSEYQVYVSDIIPIPLTPEILEKNGWMEATYLGEVIYCLELTDFMDLFLQFNSNTQEFAAGSITEDLIGNKNKVYFPQKIKYAHQLQHLLFGLGLDSSLEA